MWVSNSVVGLTDMMSHDGNPVYLKSDRRSRYKSVIPGPGNRTETCNVRVEDKAKKKIQMKFLAEMTEKIFDGVN